MFSRSKFAAGIAAIALSLTGCAGTASNNAEQIAVGVPSGWDEGVALSHLFQVALEEQGYDVKLTDAEIGLIFTGLSQGDTDLLFDGWLPETHGEYWKKYEKSLEDYGAWFDDAKLSLTVNADAPIDSLEELAENAELFDNRIVGIDAGAGLTRLTQEKVIPEYGLENMDFMISSTAAMLTELKAAQQADKDILVTLWSPHWAYSAYDLKDLADPKGALGKQESIHTFGRSGFAEDYPEIVAMIKDFHMTAEELADLENALINEGGSANLRGDAATWLQDNPDIQQRLKVQK
ncbi:MAG: glycine betaine ABC transporter substrate-binding protein [Trueperella sp.]|nr:glycine betaine ABC transporter substrate-binding protein [Trueperella sp.]